MYTTNLHAHFNYLEKIKKAVSVMLLTVQILLWPSREHKGPFGEYPLLHIYDRI